MQLTKTGLYDKISTLFFNFGGKMKKILSPLLMLIAAAIWGLAFTAQKASDTIPPFALGASRSIVAAVFLLFIIPLSDKILHTGRHFIAESTVIDIKPTELFGGITCGAILTVASFFQQAGMSMGADAGKSSFITAIYVILVPIYSLFIKKKASANAWVSVFVAAVGFFLLSVSAPFGISGAEITVFLCSLIFPLHILAVDFFSKKGDGCRISFIQFITATGLNAFLSAIFENANISDLGSCILPILYLGIMSSGVAYTLQIIGQKNTPPTASSVILSLESVFGAVFGALILGEKLTPKEIIGCITVFAAVILSQINFKKKANKTLHN